MILSNSDNIQQLDLTKELVLIDAENMPFTSLLLKNGRQKATSTTVSWDYENLDDSRGLVKEGSKVTEYQESTRQGGNFNYMNILRKSVSVSDTAQAVSQEHIADLFAHELNNRLIEIKRDLEYFLINGKKDDGLGANPRQMGGILEFVEDENKIEKTTKLSLKDLQEMAKLMRKKGTASQNMVLLCDYNTYDIVSDLFFEKTLYQGVTNEFGSPVQKLNLTYGAIIPYVIDTMPADTCIMANMDYLKLAELRPLMYYDLAKLGSSKEGYIEMENTLKVLHPDAVTMYTKKTA